LARLIYMQHSVRYVATLSIYLPLFPSVLVFSLVIAVGTWQHGASFILRCSIATQAESEFQIEIQSEVGLSDWAVNQLGAPASHWPQLAPCLLPFCGKFLASSALAACHVRRSKTVRIRVALGTKSCNIDLALSTACLNSHSLTNSRSQFQLPVPLPYPVSVSFSASVSHF